MVTITINNSTSKVEGLSEDENALLYDTLAYEDDATTYQKLHNPRLFGLDLRKRLFTRKRCTFPTGLLDRVTEKLNDITINDLRKEPEQYLYIAPKVSLPPLRPYQEEVAEIIRKQNRVTTSMCTGSGKTYTIIQAILDRKVNTLIIVPTLNLKGQFLTDLKYHLGSKNVGTHKDKELKPIVVANIQGIQKKDQEWFNHFDHVALDEVHHASSSSYYDLNKKFWNHITYRLFVSATVMRNSGDEMKLEAITGPIDFTYTSKQAIAEGYIVPPKFIVYQENHFRTPSEGWHQDYEKHLVKNKSRNDKILNVAHKFLNNTNKNMLILCNRIEHVNSIAEAIPSSTIVTGKTKENQKTFENYRLGKIRCMVATSQVLSEGVNIPQIDVLILGGGYESEILINQAIGRVVRLDEERDKRFAIVVDFYDKNQKILERHSKTRMKIFAKNYGKDSITYIK